MEFNFGNSPRTARRRTEKESLASDRLQKAIERNRAKQARRAGRGSSSDDTLDLSAASSRPGFGQRTRSRLPGSAPSGMSAGTRSSTPRHAMGMNNRDGGESSFTSRLNQARTSAGTRPAATTRSSVADRAGTRSRLASRLNKTNVTEERKTVANDENAEFTTSVKRTVRKAPAQAGYSDVSTKGRVVKKRTVKKEGLDKKSIFIIRSLWVFLAFLCVRLVFSGGGVIDYYTNLNLLHSKEKEFDNTKKDNQYLIKEIRKIKSNARYQKKLVRDHLGFIAADEYVILFPKEKS